MRHAAIALLLPPLAALACTPTAAHKGQPATDEQPVEGVVCPQLSLSTPSLTWNQVSVGTAQELELILENACNEGDRDLTLEMRQAGSADFVAELPSTATLAPGESLVVPVTFSPTQYTPAEGVLSILEGAEDALTEVPLSGTVNADSDGDGDAAVAAGGTDCDDTDPAVSGKPVEDAQDGVDDDCDGTIDEDFLLSGDLLFTELMVRPGVVGDADGEWMEIHNRAGFDVDLSGWTLSADDGEALTIDASVVVPAGGFAVLGVSGEPARNGGVSPDYVYLRDSFSLSDATDSAFLSVAGRVIAEVSWGSGWPLEEGASMALDADFTDPTHAVQSAYWCASTAAYGDGDLGTPGHDNGRCDTVDHDGDGVTVADGDCDDDDGTLFPGNPERWDGIDNDCDGVADDMDADGAVGAFAGDAQQHLSWTQGLATADPDADGSLDLLVAASATGGAYSGTLYSGNGEVWAVTGADALTATGHPRDVAFFDATGTNQQQRFGTPPPWQGDIDGDGAADLVFAGSDAYGQDVANVAVYFGGSGLTGSWDDVDADVVISGGSSYNGYYRAMGHGDLDGDGHADVFYGDARGNHGTTWYAGRLYGFSGADLVSGDTLDLEDDADMDLYSDQASANLGSSLGMGDVDGDGYDDLLVAAPGAKDGSAYATGIVYILEGSSNPWNNGQVDNLSDWQLDGSVSNERLGDAQWILAEDVDGDGNTDLLLGSPSRNTAYYIDDTTDLADREDIDRAADWTFEGDTVLGFGFAVATGDLDADGAKEIIIGAPDMATINGFYAATQPGTVYVYETSSLSGANISVGDAAFTVTGTENKEGFGAVLATGDLDADGDAELVVGSPFTSTNQGAVRIFNP